MTTVHASSPADTCYRLETLALMADIGIPLHALRRQIAGAIDLVVQTARLASGHRLVTAVSEVGFDESTQNYRITDIFTRPHEEGELEWTRTRPATLAQLHQEGLSGQIDLLKPMLEA
jgi:pilus assembly protein CpaF